MQRKSQIFKKKSLRTRLRSVLYAAIALFVFGITNVNAAGYVCEDKTYVSCNETYYLNEGNCLTCPAGCTCNGGTDQPICEVDCSAGQYLPQGSGTCTSCDKGYRCPGGTLTPSSDAAVGRYECPAGTYQDETGQTTCKTCDAGKTSSAARTSACATSCSNGANVKTWETPSWNSSSNSVSNVCKVKNCASGSYYSSASNGSCLTCAKGTYMSSDGHTNTTCSKCSDLSGVSPTGGAYTTDSTGSKANTACKYTAPAKSITGCYTVTVATVTYSGSSWPATTYTVTALKGYHVVDSGKSTATCSVCGAGSYQGSDDSTATSCTKCGKGKYQDETGQASCKDCTQIDHATWKDSTGKTTDTCPFTCTDNYTPDGRSCKACSTTAPCPDGYKGSYNSCDNQTAETDGACKINCQAGTYVADKYGTCIDLSAKTGDNAGRYVGQHYVQYGQTSGDNVKTCPAGSQGSIVKAGTTAGCYQNCASSKTIENGKATYKSGYVYYNSSSNAYDNNQCKYTVNCNSKYGAQNASGGSTNNTTNPTCTLCDIGYYSAGGTNMCAVCSGAPSGAVYTTNASEPTGCLWRCYAGYYKNSGTCSMCPGGSATVPVTSSSAEKVEGDSTQGYQNDSIQGCFINPSLNNDPTEITDNTGTFVLKTGADVKMCYHN